MLSGGTEAILEGLGSFLVVAGGGILVWVF